MQPFIKFFGVTGFHHLPEGHFCTFYYISDNEDTQRGAEAPDILFDLKDFHLVKCGKIGKGAFATVYRCENKEFGVELAMKEVECLDDQKDVDALQTEMKILSNLKHKNIVKYYGCRQDENSIAIFMEYAKGGTIRKMISIKGALCEKVVSKYCQQILEGLAYLHENNIMHRDLKCANILLDEDDNCKLTDFGVSKYCENLRSMAGAATDCGTSYWMSPECINGEDYGWKSDIWSFGATVFEMLNTEPPYRKLNSQAAMFKITTKEMELQFPPGSSNHCMSFTKLCFQKNPADRPSAKDLLGHIFVSLWNDS